MDLCSAGRSEVMSAECNEYKDLIARSLVEDLTADERRNLEAHLISCDQCRSEQKGYQQMLNLMQSVEDAPAPRHFFIPSEKSKLNLWQLFRLINFRWQMATAAMAGMIIMAGLGWAMNFRRNTIDVAALKKEILQSAEAKNAAARSAWMQEMHSQIARSRTYLTQQQKAEIAKVLTRMDSTLAERLRVQETEMNGLTRDMVNSMYNQLSRQRREDAKYYLSRFNRIETNRAIKEQETDMMLDTLFQVAEFRLQ
jgi:hypothetical protein